ncbi:MAG: DUF1573 domain-containing protein [bacterium]|nr:DUF1573 domain-containing protein [bacterium]
MNTNKYIIGALVIVVIGIALAFNYSDRAGTNNSGPITSAIAAEKDFYDFGDIEIFGGKVSTEYVLKNTGEQDVTITQAATSCMCTGGKIGSLVFGMHGQQGQRVTIPAGGKEILTATYDPLAHGPQETGKITRELMLKTNSTATPELVVRFSANVIKTTE